MPQPRAAFSTLPPDGQDPFTDILFNTLLGVFLLFATSFTLMRPDMTGGKVDPKAEYLITASWPKAHLDDVDLLVESPNGRLVWFHNREADWMHLDRDDRGQLGDALVIGGRRLVNPLNQETVTLRGFVRGEYVVNLLHYKSYLDEPVPVTLKVEKLNPAVQLVYAGELELSGAGDEKTALRFVLDAAGDVRETSRLGKLLLTSGRRP